MGEEIRRIAVNTGGGDAPGLNAVIRSIVLSALRRGWEVLGIRKGYEGLLDTTKIMQLDRDSVRGITHLGGPSSAPPTATAPSSTRSSSPAARSVWWIARTRWSRISAGSRSTP